MDLMDFTLWHYVITVRNMRHVNNHSTFRLLTSFSIAKNLKASQSKQIYLLASILIEGMKPVSRRMKQLRNEAALVVDPSEAELIASVYYGYDACMPPRVSMSTTEMVNGQEAKCVENGSIVLRLETVKTSDAEKCGNYTVRKKTKKFGNITGQICKIKVKVTPQKPRKQIMQNSLSKQNLADISRPRLKINGLVIYMKM